MKKKRPIPTSLEEIRQYRANDNALARSKAARGLRYCSGFEDDDLIKLACITGERNHLTTPTRANFELCTKVAELWTRTFLQRQAETPNLEFVFGTILNSAWDTSSEDTWIDIHRVQRETRPAINAIVPNWVSVPEMQMLSNVPHQAGGLLTMNHAHFLGFGVDVWARCETATRKYQRRFRSSFDDAPPIVVKRVAATPVDLARVIYYLWKPPYRLKTFYKNEAKGKANLHESEANDRYIRYWRMIQILAMLRVDRMVYAGGHGQAIRQDSLREALSWLRTGEADRNPPLHSDGLARFFTDWAIRTGETRFRLPVVQLNKS